MGMSLQDQLLKAGIADKKQANKARQEKRARRKKNKGNALAPEVNQTRQAQLAQAGHSRELNRKSNREKERQERLAQVRQLVEANRLDLRKCEAPFYFKVGKKIKKLYVDDAMAKKLSHGQLAIVQLDDQFDILPAKVAKQIADRDPDAVILLHGQEP